jgi:hypothetical protein
MNLLIGKFHWAERLMHFAHYMSILDRKGSVNEADAVSRRPDFFHPDDVHMCRLVQMFALWWDEKVHDLCYQSNDTRLLVLSADSVSVDDGFLTKPKTAYSSCSYFADEKTRWKGYGLIKSSDGFYTFHDRLVIPRPAQDLRILLLIEYHDNADHPNWRHLLATLLKRFCWERMSFDCKAHCSICVVCNRAKPSRQGSSSLRLLWVLLITLGKLLAWILLRTYLRSSNTISPLF